MDPIKKVEKDMEKEMHRRYGFGIYRLSQLVEWVIEIREEFDFNERELLAACQRECGVNIEKKEDTVL